MSWSLNKWGAARVEAAEKFLSTGVVGTSFGGSGCFGSNQCAVGYACIGGRCVRTDGAGGGTGGSYGGGSSGGGYYTGGSCGSGPDSYVPGGNGSGTGSCATSSGGGGGPVGCTIPTCGEGTFGYGGDDSDCCGTRCCRYQAGVGGYPTVNCYCGNCPGITGQRCISGADCLSGICINGRCADPKPCNAFCAEYHEANGGHAAGCSDKDLCDECTQCSGVAENGSNYCEEKADAPPCHCNPDAVGECDLCANDGSVVPGVCMTCCEVANYDCGCGVAVTAKVCRDRDASGRSECNLAQDAAAAECAKQCANNNEPDPCAPKIKGLFQCVEGANCDNGGPDLPPNENGKKNVWTGCIDNGTKACVLYNEEDYNDLPAECEGCDCNCHNDCPACELCNAEGKCVKDTSSPECQEPKFTVRAYLVDSGPTLYCGVAGVICGDLGESDSLLTTFTNVTQDTKFEVKPINSGTTIYGTACGGGYGCVPATCNTNTTTYRIFKDGNATTHGASWPMCIFDNFGDGFRYTYRQSATIKFEWEFQQP
jgi:hypothetical protein